MGYQIKITETLAKVVTVEANTEDEAIEKVQQIYNLEEVVLCADDFADVEFGVVGVEAGNAELRSNDSRYISTELLNKLSDPLINFIWYLWDAYFNPDTKEAIFHLEATKNGQRVAMPSIHKVIEQNLGISTNMTIIIQKEEGKHHMFHQRAI